MRNKQKVMNKSPLTIVVLVNQEGILDNMNDMKTIVFEFGLVGLWCLMPLTTIFQLYIMAVSFIGGGNRSTRRKPKTCRKSLANFIT